MGFYTKDNKKHSYGDYDKLSQELLSQLELLAAELKQELLITSGYRPNDPSSQHRLGLAVDVVPSVKIKLLDLYLAAERFKFTGIGVYPDWKNGSGEITGGLHLDVRVADKGARWVGTKKKGAAGNDYFGLNFSVLKGLGII
jgi:uncharacterized protein YcbK (DUF882 family)